MSAVAILGPGGVGGFLAGALQRAGTPVTLIAQPASAAVLRERGLHVRSVALDAEWDALPTVVDQLIEPAAVLIVATKAIGLEEALQRVAAPCDIVLPMLNGMDHMSVLRERFGGEHVAASVIRIDSERPAPGLIEQRSPVARIDIATVEQPDASAAAALLSGAGVDVRVGGTEAQVLWGKLARLNAIAVTTTAFGATLSEIRADADLAAQLRLVVQETARVAQADGVAIDAEVTLAELAQLHPDQRSSMARDVAAGCPSELDAICGVVLRAGMRHGVATPTVRRLAQQIAEQTQTSLS